jgi:hypothetical protein
MHSRATAHKAQAGDGAPRAAVGALALLMVRQTPVLLAARAPVLLARQAVLNRASPDLAPAASVTCHAVNWQQR